MGESLFDELTAAIVACGSVAVVVLRSAAECANPDSSKTRGLIGHILLEIAVSLLLFRWVAAVTSLPLLTRQNVWQSGALSVACGIGLVAAVKAVIEHSVANRVRYFVITAACGAIALFIATIWKWAIVSLMLLAASAVLRRWCVAPLRIDKPAPSDDEPQREPALVLIVSAALLLLLLGTWQHVIENETQRKTRSARYSAWPRSSALRNAWERTGWVAKPGDDESTRIAESIASRERRIAIGMSALLLAVAIASCRRSSCEPISQEGDHAV